MHPCLLKKLLPFALTFIVGATIGGLFKSGVTTQTLTERTTLMLDHEVPLGYGHSCRAYRHNLVAETKPLVIHLIPPAHWPHGLLQSEEGISPMRVRVTFGADGKVQQVEPGNNCLITARQDWPTASKDPNATSVWGAVERATRQIQFEPETINSVPVSVTKEVEIHFIND